MRVGITISVFILCFISIVKSQVTNEDIIKCNFTIENEWPSGFSGLIKVPIRQQYDDGWVMHITFSSPVVEFDIYEGTVLGHKNGYEYVIQHKGYNKIIHHWTGKTMKFYCEGSQYIDGNHAVYKPPPLARVLFIPHISVGETVHQALNRANQGSSGKDLQAVSSTTTTSAASTTSSTTTASTTTTAFTTTTSWDGFNFGGVSFTTTPFTAASTKATTPSYLKSFRYNLREVIQKSLLFFETQRSGTLPKNNRIKWRSHSGLRDGIDAGLDLSGGYYIDGGHVKYGLPMAFSMTVLAWGVIDFKRGYITSKELANTMNAIKWGTDYFIKCNPDAFTFFGQISDQTIDDSYWGRPEDSHGSRPSYKLTRNSPGSDLAGETAAALAAASIVFDKTFPSYADKLIKHAEQLYTFAERYRKGYAESIPQSENMFKPKSGFMDELAWAAVWLYKATGKETYLEAAKTRLKQDTNKNPVHTFDWDDKRAGVITLLAQITNSSFYRNPLLDFCEYNVITGGATYTPKGFLHLSKTPTALSSNAGFICLMVAELGIRSDTYRKFAQGQLNYLLGDFGFSYMIGFGSKYPKRAFHKGSSCPDSPTPCSFADRDKEEDNPHNLIGALVNGPDKWDNFEDERTTTFNGVGIHYNAGFQTLAAGILKLQVSLETFTEPGRGELLPKLAQDFTIHHDYGEVLRKSNMFYEAQMSGQLPKKHRIKWRKSACVNDKGTNMEDLSGGFFDGADYIKFNYPMAFSTTVLAWGYILYPQAYEASGEGDAVKNIIEWAADYFIKCHVSKFELYGQVGSTAIDRNEWKRPEDITYSRPAFKIDKRYPGSDLAAETAAALAAAATIFKKRKTYYNKLILHAKQLLTFAEKYRESYHRSITDAGKAYPSFNGYKDELVWASLWLYIATGDAMYLLNAKTKYKRFLLQRNEPKTFYWDDKTAGINVLLARITRQQSYINQIKKFCDASLQDNGAKYTPRGLLFLESFGPLRYAAGNSLICLVAADLGIRPYVYRDFAQKQIGYMLGDSGLGSYVVGYGPSPPKQPYHRASSCPVAPNPCNFTVLKMKRNNPHTLYGALVGGPDDKDRYTDEITSYRSNKVSLDYNAAFQSAIASLKYLELFPPPVTTTTQSTTTAQETTTQSTTPEVTTAEETTTHQTTTAANKCDREFSNKLFNDCAISIGEFPTHEIRFQVGCRFQAFETCVGDGSSLCSGNVWEYWPRWNHDADDSYHFSRDEVNCRRKPFTTAIPTIPANITIPMNATIPTTVHSNATDTQTSTLALNVTLIVSNTTASPIINSNATLSMNMTTTTARNHTTIEPTTTSSHEATTQALLQCGRHRSEKMFGDCTISVEEFQTHKDCSVFRCRYRAFQTCIRVRAAYCTDDVLKYWPMWNHEANDSYYFTQDDVQCKDKQSLDRENCVLDGLTSTYHQCYQDYAKGLVESRGMKKKDKSQPCIWEQYKECVDSYIGHCTKAWPYFELWNRGLEAEKQFVELDKICSKCSKVSFSLTLLLFSIFYYAFIVI